MSKPCIYLASQSPRRRELLQQIGVNFVHLSFAIDESSQPAETPQELVQRLALSKAQAGWAHADRQQALPVLAADTLVVLDGQVLGKPGDQAHNLAMLSQLAGRSHQVITAVALCRDQHISCRLSSSEVRFAALTSAEIHAYCRSGEGWDKAGGYAIQGAAAQFIEHLHGSYSSVMGLPLRETYLLLREFGLLGE